MFDVNSLPQIMIYIAPYINPEIVAITITSVTYTIVFWVPIYPRITSIW